MAIGIQRHLPLKRLELCYSQRHALELEIRLKYLVMSSVTIRKIKSIVFTLLLYEVVVSLWSNWSDVLKHSSHKVKFRNKFQLVNFRIANPITTAMNCTIYLKVYQSQLTFVFRDEFTLSKDGYGKIVGRLKDIIIRGGENIAPKEIEDLLNTHPDIIESQV